MKFVSKCRTIISIEMIDHSFERKFYVKMFCTGSAIISIEMIDHSFERKFYVKMFCTGSAARKVLKL